MAMTRVGVETAMVGRMGPALRALGLSVVTDGTNPDLNEPMAAGLDSFGVWAVNRASIDDADLTTLDDSMDSRYLDIVEIRALESFAVSLAFRARSQQWEDYKVDRTDQLRWLLQLIKDKTDQFNLRHGGSTGPAAVEMDCQVRDALRLRPGDPRCCPQGGVESLWL